MAEWWEQFIPNMDFIFGNSTCGKLATLLTITILVIVAKILLDRKNRIIKIAGLIIMGINVISLIFLMLSLELFQMTFFLPISIRDLIELISALLLMVFALISIANSFDLRSDNLWILIVSIIIGISESILFLVPIFPLYGFCAIPVISLIIQILILILAIVFVNLSIRLKGKRR
jgi:hypothetical protein